MKSSKTILPAGLPPISISKKTLGLPALADIARAQHIWWAAAVARAPLNPVIVNRASLLACIFPDTRRQGLRRVKLCERATVTEDVFFVSGVRGIKEPT